MRKETKILETDQQFFSKPTCPNCGSPEVYPCSYHMKSKTTKKTTKKK